MRGPLATTLYWAALILASWLAMETVHETGHILAAWLTGGTVTKVVLHPLALSRTDVRPNPHPLIVAWAGPLVGSIAPCALWVVLRRWGRGPLRVFAGFCLLVNGIYLAIGWIDRIGDAGDLLAHGASPWQLVTFGAVAVATGLGLWHGIDWRARPARAECLAVAVGLPILVALGLWVGF